jgi:Glyoxalase-like domain
MGLIQHERGTMAAKVQVVMDCSDPAELGDFWAAVLGYEAQRPPAGFDSWDAALDAAGVPATERDAAFAIVDPEGQGPRVFFQRVPEPKVVKNRVHLDVFVDRTDDIEEQHRRVMTEVARLQAIGASFMREFDEYGEFWVTMQDPEGNEFDVA